MVTLLELRNRVKQRADQESAARLSDAEINVHVNNMLQELHGLLLSSREFGKEESATIAVVSGTAWYSLPPMLALVAVETVPGNSEDTCRALIKRGNSYMAGRSTRTDGSGYDAVTYDVARSLRAGQEIRFTPSVAGRSYTIRYFPAFQKLTNDTDQIDDVNGWAEYVVIGAAIRALHKNGSSSEHLGAEFAYQRQRILDELGLMDMNQAPTIADRGADGY